ncbi:hypothetical protein M407DRAFT_31946 [Tulasnella calospora MUT 4182]|uniref:BTB domain-containing protein n=1 Tax=Tulasnella calospora MUT 4182 TaxID=1051891 RepID=A0A0C3Q4V9_9AGAM|nr:hypothetical protein M407DRAFT_31946 [Tulasnella calospora MUT 4182]
MSPLDFSEDDLVDAMSSISPTGSEVDPVDQSLVEHTLYHVPRALIQQSETYKDQIPHDDAGDALYVDGISTVEMEAFLDVSDARLVTGDDCFTFEQWAGALAVANRLVVPQIRNYVIRRLQDALGRLNPFDCVDVALKYRVQEWLFRPFLRICERREPLSSAEIVRLGSERSSAVGRVREKLLAQKHGPEITRLRSRLARRSSGDKPVSKSQPKGTETSETVATVLSVEATRLIELETVLTKPDFEPVSPSAPSSFGPIPHAFPHPKYWQRSSMAIKVDGCLYELPARYLDSSSLLEENRDGRSLNSCDPITLPQDIKPSDWDVLLEIATARPFDEPSLSLPFTSWITGLRVAKRLEVDSTRRYILQRIQSDFPAENPIDLLEAVKDRRRQTLWLGSRPLRKTISTRKFANRTRDTSNRRRLCGGGLETEGYVPAYEGVMTGLFTSSAAPRISPNHFYLSEMSDADCKSLILHERSGIPATSGNEQPRAPSKHHEFYVKDLVNLKKILFRVEGRVLAASSIFQAAMKEEEPTCSAGDDCISISNISVVQMESLLGCLYYSAVKPFSMAVYRVIAAFEIAEVLGFKELHQFLFELIDSHFKTGRFDLLTRIKYARRCRIVEWLRDAYLEIASRTDGLHEKEVKELGLEKTLALYGIREKLATLRGARTSASSKEDDEPSTHVDQELAKEASELVGSEPCLNRPDFEPVSSPAFSRTTTNDGSRHTVFYFVDGLNLVTLKIQGVLFRIPLQRVKGAKVISDLIAATLEGNPLSTDDDPLEIGCDDLAIHEFESFLKIIIAPLGKEFGSKLPFKEWAQGARVATLLEDRTSRDYIIRAVEAHFKGQDPIDLIEFAKKHEIESWLPAQYARLATRTTRITEADMRRLGSKAASEIAHRRELEAFRRGKKRGRSDAAEESQLQEFLRRTSVAKPRR